MSRSLRKRLSIYTAALLLGVVIIVLLTEGMARWSYRLSLPLTPPERPPRALPEYVLVIDRREEKSTASDDHPHRTSRSALYRKVESQYTKISPDIPVRSTSSAEQRPTEADIETVLAYTKREDTEFYPWGYASVPSGLYALVPDRDGAGQLRFVVLSWNRRSSSLQLPTPQTIRSLRATPRLDDASSSTTMTLVDVPDRTTVRSYKDSVFVHGTITRNWSHLDSQGCITYQTTFGADRKPSDYDQLCKLMKEHGLDKGEPNFAMLIREAPASTDTTGDTPMGTELPISLIEGADTHD